MATTEDTRFVRLAVTWAEHHQIRMAAASQDTNMAAFVRQSSLIAAREELEKLKSSGMSTQGKEERNTTTKRNVRAN